MSRIYLILLVNSVANSPEITAEQALGREKSVYGIKEASPICEAQDADEIVVCAEKVQDQRLPIDQSNTDTGIPRAPDLRRKHGTGLGQPLCILQKCPDPPYYIDLSSLPEAPEGSEADKIAKGEYSDH